ncbi:MAG: Flp family type IVb pilin [Dethiobacteria bacterium]|jgi:pilus assembly protein Flp/PilA
MLKQLFTRFIKDEEGQGLVEYALIIVLIAAVVIVGLRALGTNIADKFKTIGEGIKGVGVDFSE